MAVRIPTLGFAWKAFLMVKPKEKLGFYGLVAGSEQDIFLVLTVAPEMAPGVRFQLRKWPKVPFGAKMRILSLQDGIP